jgi:ribosome-binding protein aMBF1 (putative translation factor)
MIKNERQLRITKAQVARFESALRELVARNAAMGRPSVLDVAQENALRSQLEDLQAEVSEYEALKAGKVTTFRADTFGDLPAALIRARIAAGMTQKELAARLGVKEQQVQRYEATDYASASFDRIALIVRVLGVTVREEISLTGQ